MCQYITVPNPVSSPLINLTDIPGEHGNLPTLPARFIRLSSDWGDYIFSRIFYFTTSIIIILLTGCSILAKGTSATEDTTYLTPIPEATFLAYKGGSSIDNKLQAVIAARVELGVPPHFKPLGTPTVIFAKELKLADAYKLVENPGIFVPPNWVEETKVWFVVFEGDFQVTVPGEKTPNPSFHGCSYVIIRAEGGQGGGEVGGIDCSKAVGLK